jgi:hypothetical protein
MIELWNNGLARISQTFEPATKARWSEAEIPLKAG